MADEKDILSKANVSYLPIPFQMDLQNPIRMLFSMIKDFEGIPIISVGCGNGYLEAYVKYHFPTNLMIGVDPDPLEFNPIPKDFYRRKCVKPLISTLESGKLDKLIGNNLLMVIWPNPDYEQVPNYDLSAIARMKPKAFFVVYEPLGGAGSDLLLDAIQEESLIPKRQTKIGDITYYLKSVYTILATNHSGTLNTQIINVVYTQNKVDKVEIDNGKRVVY